MKDVSGYLHISIDRCSQQAAGSVPVPGILALIKECFVAHISDIVALVTEQPNLAVAIGSKEFETRFDEAFAIGPGCLDLIIDTLTVIYRFVPSDKLPVDGESFVALTDIYHTAESILKALLSCLQHLRLKHPRRLWDPKGFRNYGDRYYMSGHLLSVRPGFLSMFRSSR